MNFKKVLSWLLIGLSLIIMTASVWLCIANLEAKPVLLTVPEDAAVQSEMFMGALGDGDYSAASMLMYGMPDLGADRLSENPVGGQLWYTFQESFSYEFQGDCYASDSGIARDVWIHTLDIDLILEELAVRAPEAISERVRDTNDFSLIYDENNSYREDFVMEILQNTLVQILDEGPTSISQMVTLNLVYHDDQWWVLPDQELIRVISGGIAG